MSYRLPSKKTRAAAAAALAAAVLLASYSAIGRPRPADPLQSDAETGAEFAPAQRDQLLPVQRGGVSLAQATAMAQGRFQGRVVRAETVRVGERLVHEIRILGEDGRTVRTVRIDAETGAFL